MIMKFCATYLLLSLFYFIECSCAQEEPALQHAPSQEVSSASPSNELSPASAEVSVPALSVTATPPTPSYKSTAAPLLEKLGHTKNLKLQPYEVRGGSASELLQQMNIFGPTSSAGVRQDALVSWSFSWKLPQGEVRTPEVYYDILFTYPSWSAEDHADLDLRKRWDAFLTAYYRYAEDKSRLISQSMPQVGHALQQSVAMNPRVNMIELNSVVGKIVKDINSREELLDQTANPSSFRKILTQ